MPLQTTHSDELQEIMGRIPSKVIRYGTTVIFSILAIILVLSWLVKYPEVVSAPIVITTINPPVDLMTKSTGKIEKHLVCAGERFATVVPDASAGTGEIIGKLVVPSGRLGKVDLGQMAHVKLNGYPYMEFGILRGELASISAVPDAIGYTADVTFPDGLISTYNKPLELIYQMDGTAEIVTHDMRLIERFFALIRDVLQNKLLNNHRYE